MFSITIMLSSQTSRQFVTVIAEKSVKNYSQEINPKDNVIHILKTSIFQCSNIVHQTGSELKNIE